MKQSLQKINTNRKLAEYSRQVEACRSSGKSVREWCSENNIPVSSYYNMQRKVYNAVSSATSEVEFTELVQTNRNAASPAATIRAGSIEVDIYCGTDEETIRSICRAIKSC